jgi:hypothetical protein
LEPKCKSYEEIEIRKKGERRKQNKKKKGLREAFRPRPGGSPRPTRAKPEGVSPIFLFPH